MAKVNVSVDKIYSPNEKNADITTVALSLSFEIDGEEGPETITKRFFRSAPTAKISFYEQHLAAGTQFPMTTEKYDFRESTGPYIAKDGTEKIGTTTWCTAKL